MLKPQGVEAAASMFGFCSTFSIHLELEPTPFFPLCSVSTLMPHGRVHSAPPAACSFSCCKLLCLFSNYLSAYFKITPRGTSHLYVMFILVIFIYFLWFFIVFIIFIHVELCGCVCTHLFIYFYFCCLHFSKAIQDLIQKEKYLN